MKVEKIRKNQGPKVFLMKILFHQEFPFLAFICKSSNSIAMANKNLGNNSYMTCHRFKETFLQSCFLSNIFLFS